MSGVTAVVHQQVLDAAATLQLHRSATAAELERGGTTPQTRLVGTEPALGERLAHEARSWRHLLSVRCGARTSDLVSSLPSNRSAVMAGLRMTSVFDWDSTAPEARAMLMNETCGAYYFAPAPIQLKVVDHHEVLLQGPFVDGRATVMATQCPAVLGAAMRYWRLVMAAARPAPDAAPYAAQDAAPDAGADAEALADGRFTSRQQQVLELMFQDLTDQQIADCVGVSVRTVRYDVAHILRSLGARSRFGAGFRLGLRARA